MVQPIRIAFTTLADGSTRPVYEDASGQFVRDNDGERLYGVWWVPFDLFDLFDEPADVPIVVGKERNSLMEEA